MRTDRRAAREPSGKPQPDQHLVPGYFQPPPAAAPRPSGWDAKTLAAVAALVTALAGGVELRVQVGLLAAKVDRIEAELRGGGAVADAGAARP